MATWSYSGDPSSSILDEVRFWCQDTVEPRPLLFDEEITYLINKWLEPTGSPIFVAAVACEVIAAKLTAEISVSADGVSVSLGELQQKYITLAARLRDQVKAAFDNDIEFELASLWAIDSDPDIPSLVFGVGFMDNMETGRQDFGDYHPGRSTTGHETPESLAARAGDDDGG